MGGNLFATLAVLSFALTLCLQRPAAGFLTCLKNLPRLVVPPYRIEPRADITWTAISPLRLTACPEHPEVTDIDAREQTEFVAVAIWVPCQCVTEQVDANDT